jgi:hypothetical protein
VVIVALALAAAQAAVPPTLTWREVGGAVHVDCFSWERISREGVCEPMPGVFEHPGPAQDYLTSCRRTRETCGDTDRPGFDKPIMHVRWLCDGPRFDSSCTPHHDVVCHAPFVGDHLEGPDPRPTLYADYGRIAYCPPLAEEELR